MTVRSREVVNEVEFSRLRGQGWGLRSAGRNRSAERDCPASLNEQSNGS